MTLRRVLGILSSLGCLLLAAALFSVAFADEARCATTIRTDALVLVNSQSGAYSDFAHFVQPYLDNFGVPYTVVDVATTSVPADVGDFSLMIIGHRQIDVDGTYLDAAEENTLATAVSAGTGLVNFDNDLWTSGGAARYPFLQSIFQFVRGGSTTGSGVTFSGTHYITARHATDQSISTGAMRLAGITLPASATAVAASGNQPFVAVTTHGSGRAVQWSSYDWMSHWVLGPVHGLDDLVWRSLVWAARKPFVMQALPPIVTMRVDDAKGPFDWIHTANDFGFKPWAGLFFDEVSDADAADLSALTNAGQATASIHAFSYDTFFYFDHAGSQNFSDATVAANFALGTQWHQQHSIPISKFVLPHYYESGSNAFAGLGEWGVEFVGTVMRPGDPVYASNWAANGPYRRFESGPSSSGNPLYYADFISVPGHPELDGRFFDCLTEIRDENGYEWYPTNDVEATINHGTAQVERALDSRVLGTLFTHEYYSESISSSNWRSILQGISANLSGYGPLYMTMDDACRRVRAVTTSGIAAGTYDAGAQTVRTVLTGATDVTTSFALFTGSGDQIRESRVSVPAFSGSTVVVDSLDDDDVTPPQISEVSAGQPAAAAATITWTTDELATSQVEYGTTTEYGSVTTLDSSLANSHSQLVSGLIAQTTYHFRVLSRDAAGNLATGADSTFTTAAPALSVNDVTVTEGDAGTVNATFTVSLSAPSSLPVTVSFTTADGTALAGSDYTETSDTLTFDPGQTARAVDVPVRGDLLYEYDEAFGLALTSPAGATLSDASGSCTIRNNDAAPALSVNDVTVTEGYAGTVNATFAVSLSAPSGLPVTVSYATADGTAVAGSDYTATSGTINFDPGQTAQTVSVAVIGDLLPEDDESFAVNLSGAVNATLADAQGLATIRDPAISVSAPSTPTGVARGANLSVTWAPNAAVNAPAQFSVWLVSGGGTWTQVGLFDADNSATYTRNVAADVPVADGYSLYVYCRASSGAAWSVYGLAAGTVNVTAPTTFTSINVTAPSTPTGVAKGANLSVSWAPNVAVPAPAQFSVWLVKGGTWTQVGLFDANNGASYTRSVAADVPVANGYSLYVYYRASSGAAWSVYGLAEGTVNVTAPPVVFNAIDVSVPASVAQGADLTVTWAPNLPVDLPAQFSVWLVKGGIWTQLGLFDANGGPSYARQVAADVPVGSGYQVYVYYRASSGAPWTVYGLAPGTVEVTASSVFKSISVSVPSSVAQGADLTVGWAPNVPVAAPAQFSVWLVSSGGIWTQVGLFDADGGPDYAPNVAADVPVDSGYSLYVYYRASSGAAWSVYGLAPGTVEVTAH